MIIQQPVRGQFSCHVAPPACIPLYEGELRMPLYEYRCQQCGELFELLRRADEADRDVTCPRCGAEDVERLLSLFSQSARGCGSGGRRGFT